MRLTIAVEHTLGDATAEVLPPDIIRWERKTKQKMQVLASDLGMDDLAFLAWSSLTRTGQVTGSYDTWTDGLMGLTAGVDEAPRPTGGAS